MKSGTTGIVALLVLLVVVVVGYSSVFQVTQTQQALVVRLGKPVDVIPDARGRAAQILQVAEGYQQQAIAEAKGQSARFLSVYDEYKKAPDVTRQRLYLETMERILHGSEKLIYDGGSNAQGVLPYLPLNELSPRRQPPATAVQPQQQSGSTR